LKAGINLCCKIEGLFSILKKKKTPWHIQLFPDIPSRPFFANPTSRNTSGSGKSKGQVMLYFEAGSNPNLK